MKILMTSDTVGGVFTYTTELVRGLRNRAEVTVCTMGAPLSDHQRTLLRDAGAASVHDGGYALEWMPDQWSDVEAAGQWLLSLEEQERPDVVHLNGYVHAALPWRAPRLVVGHSCVLSWWRAVHGEPAPAAWDRYRSAVRAGLRAADTVVAPTQTMLDELRALYGPWPGRAAVIHNGIAAAGLEVTEPSDPFVLAAGRMWDPAKNLTALDCAAAGLPWPVWVAGGLCPPGGSPVVTRNVRTVGALSPSRLRAIRRRAAVFAAPALYEPFGLAILEAAQDARPLVLGDIPSLRELWDGAARFVGPADATALRETLRDLMGDDSRRHSLGRAARRRAGDLSATAMSAAYLDAYARLRATMEAAA